MRSLWQAIVGAGEVAVTVILAPLLRSRYNGWGATRAERSATMPGDDLVPAPRLGYTRALTITAPPAGVWQWLVQIGQGRGGLYSFDALENLARCDIHSADSVLPQFQELRPGDLVRLGPEGYPCFRVARAAAPTELVLVAADPRPPHEAATAASPAGAATWQWLLRGADGDRRTRLAVRQRLTYPRRMSVLWHLVEPVAFVMERQMLLGIKRRAESAANSARTTTT